VAIYVPRARRRRNLILIGVVSVVAGLVVGGLVGRASAPTVDDRVSSVHRQARDIAAQLRVVSLHAEGKAASLEAGGDAGAELALSRTETDLRRLFRRAPWIGPKTATDVLAGTVALRSEAPGHAGTPAFGQQVDALAARIEATFGVKG
jgi:hypothetical protein